jgi:hypothetical protein
MTIKDSNTAFCCSNSNVHVKEFLRKLLTIWADAIKKVRQACYRVYPI